MPTRTDDREALLQGTLDLLVLRVLALGRHHGHGIALAIEARSGRTLLVDHGSLYPALQRLLQREWITAQWKTSPNSRRAKYYRLTPLGRQQLVTATSKWERFVGAMSRILAPES